MSLIIYCQIRENDTNIVPFVHGQRTHKCGQPNAADGVAEGMHDASSVAGKDGGECGSID